MKKETKLISNHGGIALTFTLLIIFHFSFLINNCFTQWITQFESGHPIRDIEFINRYTGWACGYGMIYKITNGGKNWKVQPNPAQSLIEQLHPVNENIVYAAGWWTFMKTTNGGENWNSIFTGGPGSGLPVLEGLYFLNENTGWLCGRLVAMKTTDGGNTFIDSMRVEALLQDIFFKNEMEGIASGMTGVICKTSNSGANWERHIITGNGPMYDFMRLTFFDNQTGWVGGNVVYKTTDFGTTWDSIGTGRYPINQVAYCIEFSNMNTGFTGGSSGYFAKTTDGGYSWTQEGISSLGAGYILDVFAYNDSILWAGTGLQIIHTTTGGQVFINQISSEIPGGYKLYQNYPNPFNSETIITYELRRSVSVELNVYNILGEKTTTLVNEKQDAGTYQVYFIADELPSGVYFYLLFFNEKMIASKKMLLLK